MTTSHEIRFDANGAAVYAEFQMFSRSGRTTVQIDGTEIACVEWVDFDPKYLTDEGLKALALSEIATVLEFNQDPGNFGEDEAPDETIAALCERVLQ